MGGGVSRPSSAAHDRRKSTGRRRSSGGAVAKFVLAKMAKSTNFDKEELIRLKAEFDDIAGLRGKRHTVNRSELQQALAACGIMETDKELLDILFSHMDHDCNGEVDFQEFVASCSPMISGDIAEKLHFSFELYDVSNSGTVRKEDMLTVLNAMNRTASWFGDPCLTAENIRDLVDHIFAEGGGEALDYTQYLDAVVSHPILVQFVTGEAMVEKKASLADLSQFLPAQSGSGAGATEAVLAATAAAVAVDAGIEDLGDDIVEVVDAHVEPTSGGADAEEAREGVPPLRQEHQKSVSFDLSAPPVEEKGPLHATALASDDDEMKIVSFTLEPQVKVIEAIEIPPNPRIAGDYTDPNHPKGFRTITLMTGEAAVVDGNDDCPKTQGATWSIEARVQGSGILIDFSLKGGPKGLLGKFDGTGIVFADGNRWEKAQPAIGAAHAGRAPAQSCPDRSAEPDVTVFQSASG